MHYIHEKFKHMKNQFRATTYVIRALKKKKKNMVMVAVMVA